MTHWRSILIAGLLIVPATYLLAFGPRGKPNATTGAVVVHYWEKWTNVEGDAIQRIVDRFNATVGAERGIFVDYNAITDVEKRMLVATAGGDPPDVAGLFDHVIPQFAEQNALLPLDELVAAHGVDTASFKPIWLDICRYRGRLYALPSTPYTIALLYNRRLFREAGLDPDRPPQTTAELLDDARKLTRRENGRLVQIGFSVSPQMLGWWHWVWPLFFDAQPWDGKRFRIDTPEARAAYEWIREYREWVGNADLLAFESVCIIEGPQNPFLDERLAMVFQGPWMTNWIRTYRPALDYGVARFPSVSRERPHSFASADVFVIPRGAPHVREAMTFLAWMMRPENLDELCAAHGKVSAFRTPSPGFYEQHRNPHVRTFDALADSPYAFGYPAMPMWSEAWTETLAMLESVLRGTRSPEAALAAAQARLDRVVDSYWRMARRRGRQEE